MDENKEYIPTLAEKKILEALAEPENYTASITDLCKKADVGRNTYYNMCKKPQFVKMRNEILNRLFENFVPEVKKAAVKYAISNAKNFQDRKMILEMAGEYRPKQDINLVDDNINTSELKKELDKLEKLQGK
ncbi:phBC6A51 family helix-turn-helix protein [Clostridium sp. FP1]|uniref:phBC6A51 family helix-turn-helix protein n=1 Tax=Clostridium sp. FP1 TaxID=2724076 RepID=UPI0013E9088C|nr:phBC6A51 family helix-turn-helix protein [Clostridium sp. FP1]MBZ9635599.1 hypothetical protein [Clostridium sp. FP1]